MAHSSPTNLLSDAALEARRKALRRGLVRANTAAAVILLIVAGLALAAVWQTAQARRHAARADRSAADAAAATRRAEDELRKERFAQARAVRASGMMGRRTESLAALRTAAMGRPSLELRNEAIATLALVDLREEWFQRIDLDNTLPFAFDTAFAHYAIGDEMGAITVRARDGAVAATLRSPIRRALRLGFSPDSQFLAASFTSGRRMVWDWRQSNMVIDMKFTRGNAPHTVAFSRDSRVFATGVSAGVLRCFERAEPGRTWTELKPLPLPADVQQFALDAAGDHAALAERNEVAIRRREDGALVASQSFAQNVTKLAWHPNGRSCAVGLINGMVLLWNLAVTNAASGLTNVNVMSGPGHTARITQLEFSPRGEWLVSAAEDGTTRLWSPPSRRLLLTSQQGLALGFDREGRRLGFVKPGEGLGVWEITGGVEFRATVLPDSGRTSTRTVDFSPDGRWLVATSPKHLTFWNVAEEEPPWLMPAADCFSAHFSADGKCVLTTSARGVELWPWAVAERTGVALGEPQILFPRRAVGRAGVTRGSQEWLAVGGRVPTLIDLAAPEAGRPLETATRQQFAALSPDGRWLAASAGTQDTTRVINAATGGAERELDARGGPLNFSPAGDCLVVGTEQEFVAFDTATWQVRWRLARDAAVAVGGASAFSRDGAWLALNVTRDRVRLVDSRNGVELATLTAPLPQNIAGLAFSHSGDFLAARAEGREIQVWNLREVRRQLSAMGLDYVVGREVSGDPSDKADPSDPSATAHSSLLTTTSSTPTHWPVALPLGGAVLALGFGVYTFRYQRRLVRSYDEVERLVSERNRALQQARADLWHSQKMKALGTLAAGIAHDFNNLLSVIRLSNDFLRRGVAGQSDLVEEADAIEQAVQQGKTVAESMLGYSRSQSDVPQAVRVPDVVEETLGLLSQQFLSGTRLTLELDRETPPVVLSRGRLGQILLNLIVNAAEAMNGAGQLAVTVRPLAAVPKAGLVLAPREAPSYVELVVADSGPGIAPHVLPRIFEPFFTTKNVGATRGTGLGLSMVYSAAQADGLGLAVESTPGRGTTFRVVIPRRDA
jgi:signal transduction histidine kinase